VADDDDDGGGGGGGGDGLSTLMERVTAASSTTPDSLISSTSSPTSVSSSINQSAAAYPTGGGKGIYIPKIVMHCTWKRQDSKYDNRLNIYSCIYTVKNEILCMRTPLSINQSSSFICLQTVF